MSHHMVTIAHYLVSVHNVRYLRYARPKIAHPEFSGLLGFQNFACLDLEHSDQDT
jgi:hypothetical protein